MSSGKTSAVRDLSADEINIVGGGGGDSSAAKVVTAAQTFVDGALFVVADQATGGGAGAVLVTGRALGLF